MIDADRDYELPEMPVPSDRFSNLLMLVLFWVAVIGLAFPAWTIGAPWGWFAYAGSVLLLFMAIELQSLNNILVRTLPALRLLLVEAHRLRTADEKHLKTNQA